MNNAAPPLLRRGALLVVGLLLAAAVTTFVLAQRPQVAQADLNDNHTDCTSQIRPDAPDPDDPTASVVHYRFKCSNPLTGFQIVPGKDIQGFETEVFASDVVTGDVVPGDAFSCDGDIPGLGLNCIGNYTGQYHVVEGTFKIAGKLCAQPRSARIKPVLTVMRAYTDSKGKVAQAIAGPFAMGGPKGCPKPVKPKKAAKKSAAKR